MDETKVLLSCGNIMACCQAVHEDILGDHFIHLMTVMCMMCAVLCRSENVFMALIYS